MEPTNPEIVEVELSVARAEPDEALVEESLVETDSRSVSTTLSAVLLAGLLLACGALLWPRLSGDDTPAAASEDSSAPTSQDRELFEADDDGKLPGPTSLTDENDSHDFGPQDAVDAREEPEEPAPPLYPLFPEAPGLSVVITTVDGVVVLDADDGSRQVLPVAWDEVDRAIRSDDQVAAQLFGDSIVAHHGDRVIGYSLRDGALTNFGDGADYWVAENGDELHVLRSDSPGSQPFDEAYSIARFGLDKRLLGDPVEVPRADLTFVFPMGEGLFSVWGGGVFRLIDDGFQRVTADAPLGLGANHLIVQECDDQLNCLARMVDHRTGEAQGIVDLGPLTIFQISGELSISPSGQHVSAEGLSPDGAEQLIVIDVANGERWALPASAPNSFDIRGGISWTPDGRYLVSLNSRRITILDPQSQTVTGHDLEALNISGVRSAADVVVLD